MIVLERFCDHARETEGTPPLGCLGEILIDGQHFCYTIEQPWRHNRRFVSCVPVGRYEVRAFTSPKYGEALVLVNPDLNVVAYHHEAGPDDRYACLVHAANWSHQLQGCIAPGDGISYGQNRANVNTKPNIMVTRSTVTLQALRPLLADQELLIRWKHER